MTLLFHSDASKCFYLDDSTLPFETGKYEFLELHFSKYNEGHIIDDAFDLFSLPSQAISLYLYSVINWFYDRNLSLVNIELYRHPQDDDQSFINASHTVDEVVSLFLSIDLPKHLKNTLKGDL
jgi:hypothetical protein